MVSGAVSSAAFAATSIAAIVALAGADRTQQMQVRVAGADRTQQMLAQIDPASVIEEDPAGGGALARVVARTIDAPCRRAGTVVDVAVGIDPTGGRTRAVVHRTARIDSPCGCPGAVVVVPVFIDPAVSRPGAIVVVAGRIEPAVGRPGAIVVVTLFIYASGRGAGPIERGTGSQPRGSDGVRGGPGRRSARGRVEITVRRVAGGCARGRDPI